MVSLVAVRPLIYRLLSTHFSNSIFSSLNQSGRLVLINVSHGNLVNVELVLIIVHTRTRSLAQNGVLEPSHQLLRQKGVVARLNILEGLDEPPANTGGADLQRQLRSHLEQTEDAFLNDELDLLWDSERNGRPQGGTIPTVLNCDPVRSKSPTCLDVGILGTVKVDGLKFGLGSVVGEIDLANLEAVTGGVDNLPVMLRSRSFGSLGNQDRGDGCDRIDSMGMRDGLADSFRANAILLVIALALEDPETGSEVAGESVPDCQDRR